MPEFIQMFIQHFLLILFERVDHYSWPGDINLEIIYFYIYIYANVYLQSSLFMLVVYLYGYMKLSTKYALGDKVGYELTSMIIHVLFIRYTCTCMTRKHNAYI